MAQVTTISIDVGQKGKAVSRFLTGSCIEDVNHEIYGGIYSQMIFGESFGEPAQGAPVKGMIASEGEWKVLDGGVLEGAGGSGPKLMRDPATSFTTGEAGVEVFLPGNREGNAGLVVRGSRAGAGADNFDGYEVSLDALKKVVVLGRHRHDYRLLKQAACDIGPDKWIALRVKLTERTIEVFVDGKSVMQVKDPQPLRAGAVGLRLWQRPARYRKLWAVDDKTPRAEIPFEAPPTAATSAIALSGMWRPVMNGAVNMEARIETTKPFVGSQSQRITFGGGTGEVGIENRGLNRQGMNFVGGKAYEGFLWVRAERYTQFMVCMESGDGSRRVAKSSISVEAGDVWRRADFTLTPDTAEASGRFAIVLSSPGSVVVGHVFLQPGEWGRFKGLVSRKDVVEGLIDQGVTVMRYGGSMVNAPEYRWKKMIGPRERREPYVGHWYRYSTNGWGIIDFLNMCEVAGFLGIPDLNVNESAQDLADFVEYANGPAGSEWGKRRVADGHPAPYHLRHIELGNEEKVDDSYYQKFEAIAKAVWAKDADLILVVGDFQYERPITDPMNFRGAASRITSLSAHKKILDLVGQAKREVWFDVHVGTEGPKTANSITALPTYIDAIDKLAGDGKHRVLVFELNANNHSQRRALANAVAIGVAQRDGRLPIVTSANALQVDHQNDNGWDQGLLYLNPAITWLQPPGYVTQMISRSYEPVGLEAKVSKVDANLDVTAAASEDRKTVVLRVVNLDTAPRTCEIRVEGLKPVGASARGEELGAAMEAVNTAGAPAQVKPRGVEWKYEVKGEAVGKYTFAAGSFTVLRIE
jgi:hypothetical protein